MMANMTRLSLLWIIALVVYHVKSQCTSAEGCLLRNTRGISTNFSIISKRSIYPRSCLRLCFKSSECIATTHDPSSDTCELHETVGAGSPCMTLVSHVGNSFWMLKQPERPCPKVWRKFNSVLSLAKYIVRRWFPSPGEMNSVML